MPSYCVLAILVILLTTAQSDLNRLAKAFADQMNGIQQYVNGNEQACYYDRQNDVLVKNPPALFEGTTAGDIKINNDVYNNPDLVAAARLDTSALPIETFAVPVSVIFTSTLARLEISDKTWSR